MLHGAILAERHISLKVPDGQRATRKGLRSPLTLHFSLSYVVFPFRIGEGNGDPLQYACLGNPITEELGGLQSRGSKGLDTTVGEIVRRS